MGKPPPIILPKPKADRPNLSRAVLFARKHTHNLRETLIDEMCKLVVH
jgi:hypothetical protein